MRKPQADERVFDPKVLAEQKFTINAALNVSLMHSQYGSPLLCGREREDSLCGPGQGLRSHHCLQPLAQSERHAGSVAIIVGAGPSLDRNVDLLGEVPREGFTVLATDGAFPALLKRNLWIDGVVTCELDGAHVRANHRCTEALVDGLEKFTVGLSLYASAVANHEFVKRWRGPIEWYVDFGWFNARWYGAHADLYPGGLPVLEPVMPASGAHAVAVAKALGCREAILLGCDFGVPIVGGTELDAGEFGNHHCLGFPPGVAESPGVVHESFLEMLRGFDQHADRDWRFPVTNCSEGGYLRDRFQCDGQPGRACTLAEKLTELKPGSQQFLKGDYRA